MNYTKGERQIYCADDYWLVEVKDKPNRPNKLIGKFKTKEDAQLDVAAPDMYEALKTVAMGLVNTVLYQHPDDKLAQAQKEVIEKALQKAEEE
jgi:hypothetical protein